MSQQKKQQLPRARKEDAPIEEWDVERMFHPPHHDFGKSCNDGNDSASHKERECELNDNDDSNFGNSFEADFAALRQDHHRRIDATANVAAANVCNVDAPAVYEQDAFSIKFSLSQEYKEDDASFSEYCAVGPCQTMNSFPESSLFPSPLPLHSTETFDFGENYGGGSPLPALQLSTTPSPPRGSNKLDSTDDQLKHNQFTISDQVRRKNKLSPRRFQMDLIQSNSSSDDHSQPSGKPIPYHSFTTPIHAHCGGPTQHQSPGQTIYNIASTSADSPQSPYQPYPWRHPSIRQGAGISPSESHESSITSPEFYPPRGYVRDQNRSANKTIINVTNLRNETQDNVGPVTPSSSQLRQAVSDESVSPALVPTVHHPSRDPDNPTSSAVWSETHRMAPATAGLQSHQAPWNGHNLPPALPSSGSVYHHTGITPFSPYNHPHHQAKSHALEESRVPYQRHLAEEAHWRKHQHLLHQFLLRFGHCNVPEGYGIGTHYESLYQWCSDQRSEYQNMCRGIGGKNNTSLMTPDRVRILTSMGFIWGHSLSSFRQSPPSNSSEKDAATSRSYSTWERWVELLSEYKQQFGDVDVPLKYEPNLSLGTFVNRQRAEYRKMQHGKPTSMTTERIEQLNRLGFTWTIRENHTSWEDRLNELKDFKSVNGHCNVPKVYAKNPRLGYWVNEQRFQYRRKMKGQSSYMTDDKIKELNDLEFKVSVIHSFAHFICIH